MPTSFAPRRLRWLAGGVALCLLVVTAGLALRELGIWVEFEPGRIRPVEPGDREIAWLAPATSAETWERLVKAVRLLANDCQKTHGTGSKLSLNDARAFLQLTADVPELGLSFGDSGTLWIRWYKLSGGNDVGHWIEALRRRGRPPLAIVGGETSDRALALADILAQKQDAWFGSPPLLLITTATAERYLPANRPDLEARHDQWPRLLGVYPGRTFRFCFTNTRMVESVLEFVHLHPEVWPRQAAKPPAEPAPAKRPPFFLFTLTWADDGYSTDLASAFHQRFARMVWERYGKETEPPADGDIVVYSVGGLYQPNPREEMAVGLFLSSHLNEHGDQPQLLVLPTGTQRARRFLRTLCSRAPKDVRNIVVANGDAIGFNNVYRDRDLAWNIQDLPVPLVFFSHRDPIDAAAGFERKEQDRVERSSTQDLLLFRDLFEAMVLATFDESGLIDDDDVIRTRLRSIVWTGDRIGLGKASALAFFDVEGNRSAGTGEHIVWLRPHHEGARVLAQADLSVWRTGKGAAAWQRVGEPLTLYYDRSADEGAVHESR